MPEFKVEVRTESTQNYYVEATTAEEAKEIWSQHGVYSDTTSFDQEVTNVEETDNA